MIVHKVPDANILLHNSSRDNNPIRFVFQKRKEISITNKKNIITVH